MQLKKVNILGILLVVLMLLTACSSSEVPEKQLQEDLENSTIYTDLNISTTEFSVIKRQTDEEAKTDLVYVTIKGESDTYSVVRNYLMTYGLYNDGWVLDNVESYQDDQNVDKTIPLVTNQAEIEVLTDAGYEVVADEIYEENSMYFNKISYNVLNEYQYMDEVVQYNDYYYFNPDIYEWEYWDYDFEVLEEKWNLNGTWHFETESPERFGYYLHDDAYFDYKIKSFDGKTVDLEYTQSIVATSVNSITTNRTTTEYKASGSGVFEVKENSEYGLYVAFEDGNTEIILSFDRDYGVVNKGYAFPLEYTPAKQRVRYEKTENWPYQKGDITMARRKLRSDCRVGTAEKKLGLPPGSIRNPNGRDARSDKKIGTLRKDFEKK